MFSKYNFTFTDLVKALTEPTQSSSKKRSIDAETADNLLKCTEEVLINIKEDSFPRFDNQKKFNYLMEALSETNDIEAKKVEYTKDASLTVIALMLASSILKAEAIYDERVFIPNQTDNVAFDIPAWGERVDLFSEPLTATQRKTLELTRFFIQHPECYKETCDFYMSIRAIKRANDPSLLRVYRKTTDKDDPLAIDMDYKMEIKQIWKSKARHYVKGKGPFLGRQMALFSSDNRNGVFRFPKEMHGLPESLVGVPIVMHEAQESSIDNLENHWCWAFTNKPIAQDDLSLLGKLMIDLKRKKILGDYKEAWDFIAIPTVDKWSTDEIHDPIEGVELVRYFHEGDELHKPKGQKLKVEKATIEIESTFGPEKAKTIAKAETNVRVLGIRGEIIDDEPKPHWTCFMPSNDTAYVSSMILINPSSERHLLPGAFAARSSTIEHFCSFKLESTELPYFEEKLHYASNIKDANLQKTQYLSSVEEKKKPENLSLEIVKSLGYPIYKAEDGHGKACRFFKEKNLEPSVHDLVEKTVNILESGVRNTAL